MQFFYEITFMINKSRSSNSEAWVMEEDVVEEDVVEEDLVEEQMLFQIVGFGGPLP